MLLFKAVRRWTGNHISLQHGSNVFLLVLRCISLYRRLYSSGQWVDIALGTECWEYPHLRRSQLVAPIRLTTFLPPSTDRTNLSLFLAPLFVCNRRPDLVTNCNNITSSISKQQHMDGLFCKQISPNMRPPQKTTIVLDLDHHRGGKTQNFPGSNFLRAKTFRTKCAKPFLTTSLKSALLPLTTLPKNA